MDILDDLPEFIFDHRAERAHRCGDRSHRDESRDDPAIHDVARAGDVAHATRPDISKEERIHADDDEHRQQREENRSLVLEEDEEVALCEV